VSSSNEDTVEREILRDARHSLDAGRPERALEVLRQAVRRRSLSPQAIGRAGQLIRKALEHTGRREIVRVLLLGQCTTSWLKNAVTAEALGAGIAAIVDDGLYDNILQEVAALPASLADNALTLALLPWNERLLANSPRTSDQRVEDELAFWSEVWRTAQSRGVARIIQVGLDWMGPGALGYHLTGVAGGDAHLIRRVNDALRQALPHGSYFVPLEEISGMDGRDAFYDRRRQLWTRQPFSERGLVSLAEHIVAGLRAVTTGPKKVLVVDLDNTLWGGVVGEAGAAGIVLGHTPEGEAFVAFQRYLKALSGRGILLAVCSKNNPADAREPFLTNSDIALSLDDFAAFEANWGPKVDGLRRIAESLNLGLDSFVFFDDNPAEREHVRQALPDVVVVDVPEDPADYVRALEDGLSFETVALTDEDTRRRERYALDGRRRTIAREAGSVDEYLRSLEMAGTLRPIDESDLPRVAQLIGKTNQFNLTTRRHGVEQVRALLGQPDAIGITLRLRDRFGEHGMIGVVLAVPSHRDAGGERVLRVDTFLMSCRVIGRTAEHLLVQHLIGEARRRGFAVIHGEFVPTAKNALVRDFWQTMGFGRVASSDATGDATEIFELRVADALAPDSFVRADA
jgi:FkbH-like protein